jgi:hypothetical protein
MGVGTLPAERFLLGTPKLNRMLMIVGIPYLRPPIGMASMLLALWGITFRTICGAIAGIKSLFGGLKEISTGCFQEIPIL